MPNALETHETSQEHLWQEDDSEILPAPTIGHRAGAIREAWVAWRNARRRRQLEQIFARTQAPETAHDVLAREYPDIYMSMLG
jgi:hypothetical protein